MKHKKTQTALIENGFKQLSERRHTPSRSEIGKAWVNKKVMVLSALYSLTDNRAIKQTICYTGVKPDESIYNLVRDNLKEFERLHEKTTQLKMLLCQDIHNVLIDPESFMPINSQLVNTQISVIHMMEVLRNPRTKTDKINQIKIQNFIDAAGRLKNFDANDLFKLWKKQRCSSLNFNTVSLRKIVLMHHAFIEIKRLKKWRKK